MIAPPAPLKVIEPAPVSVRLPAIWKSAPAASWIWPVLTSEVVALEAAGSAIHGILRLTEAAGSNEILTVAAQEEFVAPGTRFLAQPC